VAVSFKTCNNGQLLQVDSSAQNADPEKARLGRLNNQSEVRKSRYLSGTHGELGGLEIEREKGMKGLGRRARESGLLAIEWTMQCSNNGRT
jgi:hypothetical protein